MDLHLYAENVQRDSLIYGCSYERIPTIQLISASVNSACFPFLFCFQGEHLSSTLLAGDFGVTVQYLQLPRTPCCMLDRQLVRNYNNSQHTDPSVPRISVLCDDLEDGVGEGRESGEDMYNYG